MQQAYITTFSIQKGSRPGGHAHAEIVSKLLQPPLVQRYRK